MRARIVALLLVLATLWSLISVQDLDPSVVSEAPSRPAGALVVGAVALDFDRAADRAAAAVEVTCPSGACQGAPLLDLQDRVWSAHAEIAADLPDVLPDQVDSRPRGTPGARLLRERWLAPLPPYLDGPRRPPRVPAVA